MQEDKVKGIFITFEGPDGAGKTTQLKRLAAVLEQTGRDIVITREPGGTPIGDQIRSIILSPDNKEMVDQTEVLLYAASRAQHVHELILPSLEAGKIVLCDRFIDASVAYQAYGLGIDPAVVEEINRFASSGLQPARTYLLDIPAEVGYERLRSRAGAQPQAGLDRIEQKALDYHRKVREAFLKIAREHQQRVCLVDANRTEDEIAEDILKDCQRLLDQVFS
jgi:dTMP kinase